MDQVISELFSAVDEGDPSAAPALFSALYADLHRLAKHELARNGAGVTIGPTTLLHEAYLEISGREIAFPDRARFMGYASRAMRGLIIDYARKRQALKRGGQFEITSLGTEPVGEMADAEDMARVSDALDELARFEPKLAEVVDLKFFCGFSFAEIGAMHGSSERTVQRSWEKARIYLSQSLRDEKLSA